MTIDVNCAGTIIYHADRSGGYYRVDVSKLSKELGVTAQGLRK
jgi:hypothetical protein